MSTKHLMKKLPSCLLGAVLAAGIASTTVNAVDGDPLGQFELDGNTQDGVVDTNDTNFVLGFPDAGTDWDYLHLETLPLPDNLIAFTGVIPDPAPKTIFWKGGSKDVNDVDEWWFKEGSVSDKSNITNAYAAAFSNPTNVCFTNGGAVEGCDDTDLDLVHAAGDLIVYFGMDRFANNGDTFGGFWFFQDPAVGLPVDINGNVLSSGEFNGVHKARRFDPSFPDDLSESLPGDVLVLVEYPQASGATPEIKVYEWDPDQLLGTNVAPNLALRFSSADAECDGSGGKLACAIVNLVSLPNPPWDYTPTKGNDTSDMPTQTFFEGGINLTGILGTTPCISSFLAETRSSRSETASLEDFAFGEFDACSAKVSKSCKSEISANGNEVTVTFFGEVNNTGGLPLDIELEDWVYQTKQDETDDTGTQGLSTFTKVCVDDPETVGGTVGRCDDGEAEPSNLILGAIASFTLGGGQTVVYEGEYVLTLFDEETPFTDKVILSFFDPSTNLLIDTDFAISAECPPDGNPSILVDKNCTDGRVVDGDTFEADISGTVKNTGNVKLINVTLTDVANIGPAVPLTVVYDLDDSGTVTEGDTAFTNGGSLDAKASLAFEGTVSSGTPSHKDTLTAEGTNVFDPDSEPVSHSDDATCALAVTPGLTITKVCDPAIGGGSGVELVVDGNQVVVQVGNIITVTNTGIEDLEEVTISDTEVQSLTIVVTDPPTGAGLDCSGGSSCTGTLEAGETVTFKQTYKPDGGSITGGLGTPNTVFFNNIASAQGTGVLSGTSVNPPDAEASCELCP